MKLSLVALAAGAVLLAGCAPSFYDGVPPGAPKDAFYASVGGARLRFVEEGEGPPVVLLHGFASALETWRAIQAAGLDQVVDHVLVDEELRRDALATLPDGDQLSFNRLRDMIELTPGNLITHLRKLEEAGYLTTSKTGSGPASRTSVALTHDGRHALETYATTLRGLLNGV